MAGFSEEPAAPFGARLDKAAFLAWVQAQEGGRFEFKDGAIVMHAGSTRRHANISTRFASALVSRLPSAAWNVMVADFAVEIGEDIRYPDVLVERSGDGAPDAMSTTKPVLLVEVLSPSSVGRDLNVKLAEYVSLPSLQCYVVASQDEPMAWVWQRDAATGAFSPIATEMSGPEGKIAIAALGIEIALDEIYAGIIPKSSPRA